MILKSDDCRKIMDLVKVFDKDFKNNKKGIFVFKNNFVLFDLYKAVIIKTSENVKKEYMFELTNEMVKGFAKYSDIALFEDLDVLQIVIDDKKKTQIICKPLSENDKIVPISSLKKTLERNLGQDDFLELKLELTDKEFTNDLEIMLEIEKLIKERKMIIKNGITYSFEISSQNKVEFNFFNSVETDDVSETEKKMNALKEYDWDYVELSVIKTWAYYLKKLLKNKEQNSTFTLKRKNGFGEPFLFKKDNAILMAQPIIIRKKQIK